MADKTDISWTCSTWQIVTGCSVDTPGCKLCYAMDLAGTRLKNHPSRIGLTREVNGKHVWTGEVRFNEGWLAQPFQWRCGREIFVAAHGDLFHEKVPFEWLDRIFGVMALNPHHTFQLLTKRSMKMRAYAEVWFERLATHQVMIPHPTGMRNFSDLVDWIALPKILPNVHFGVSCEDQKRADLRIPDLLATPAAKRFVSAEPLLEPIDFNSWPDRNWLRVIGDDGAAVRPRVDQIITGGESGRGKRRPRPVHVDAFRSLRDQCAAAGVAFFHKQNGSWIHESQLTEGVRSAVRRDGIESHIWPDGSASYLVGTAAAGNTLDWRRHEERP